MSFHTTNYLDDEDKILDGLVGGVIVSLNGPLGARPAGGTIPIHHGGLHVTVRRHMGTIGWEDGTDKRLGGGTITITRDANDLVEGTVDANFHMILLNEEDLRVRDQFEVPFRATFRAAAGPITKGTSPLARCLLAAAGRPLSAGNPAR